MIATAKQLSKVFRRNATLDVPEKDLLFAVPDQTVADLKDGSKYDRSTALSFVRSSGFEGLCEAIDINCAWVRHELAVHANATARF